MSSTASDFADLSRFTSHDDWFVADWRDGIHCIRAWAPAERLTEQFQSLAQHLASHDDRTVDLFVHDRHHERRLAAACVELTEVRDAINKIRLPLSAFGGVEISLATATDQLVLTPELLLVIYARTPRWPFLLEASGFVQRTAVPSPTWSASEMPQTIPAIATAVNGLVERFRLQVQSV